MAKVAGEKSFSEVIKDRRATNNFEEVPIHAADLEKIIRAGLEAPSGYNLQPWRFIVVRDREQKKKLQQAAFGQPKVGEASAVVVACGDPKGWKDGDLEEMIRLAKEHGMNDENLFKTIRQNVTSFLGNNPGKPGGTEPTWDLWVNRHVMIAFTTMMWMAEVLGYDTAPMEGFHEEQVRELLKVPAHVRVVALLAIGRRKGSDKPDTGRFDISRTVFSEEWGHPSEI